MAMDDQIRASDSDRDSAAAALRGHFAAGRLDAGELDERVAAALSARTVGELRSVLADLPPARLPEPGRAGLERCYRRLLLASYPAAWRREHTQEIVAVLMAAAPAGRRRPGLAEAADLVAGGQWVRCQPTRDGGEPAWRDALAVVTVLLPLVVLTTIAVTEAWVVHIGQISSPGAWQWAAAQLTVPLGLAFLALLRHYRRAAVAVAAAGIVLAVLAGWTNVSATYDQVNAYVLLAVAVQAVAVASSPGPRRALALLTWRGAALTVIAAAAVAVTSYPLSVAAVVFIIAAMTLSSSLGRWLLLLLAVPLWPYLTNYAYPAIGSKIVLRLNIRPLVSLNHYLLTATSWQGQFYLFPAFLLCLFAAAAWRDARRPRQLARL